MRRPAFSKRARISPVAPFATASGFTIDSVRSTPAIAPPPSREAQPSGSGPAAPSAEPVPASAEARSSLAMAELHRSCRPLRGRFGALLSGAVDFRDHVATHELDRLHHLRVRDPVRVQQTEQQVDTGRGVPCGARPKASGAPPQM